MAKKDYHGFEDIVQGEKGIFGDACAGICEGSAMTEFSKAAPEPGPQGVVYKITCEGCGQRSIVVTWPEMVALKFSVSPHMLQIPNLNDVWGPAEWAQGQWAPRVNCICHKPIPLSIAPGEIESVVRQGVMNQWIHPQTYQTIQARAAQVRGGGGY